MQLLTKYNIGDDVFKKHGDEFIPVEITTPLGVTVVALDGEIKLKATYSTISKRKGFNDTLRQCEEEDTLYTKKEVVEFYEAKLEEALVVLGE